MRQFSTIAASVATLLACSVPSIGAETPTDDQQAHEPPIISYWSFVPAYTLPLRAGNVNGPRPMPPESRWGTAEYEPAPLWFNGMRATDRITRLLRRDELPTGPFSLEMWVLDHGNQIDGALMAAKGDGPDDDLSWGVGYIDRRVTVLWGDEKMEAPVRDYEYKRWQHLVMVYDGQETRLYAGGQFVGSQDADGAVLDYPDDAALECAAYTENEPHKTFGNLVYHAWMYGEAIDETHIADRFTVLKHSIDEAVVFPGRFHFTAGPYLNSSTQTSMSILWETDRPTTGVVQYGTTLPLDREAKVTTTDRLGEVKLTGLEPSTNYYYRVLATDANGQAIDSGVLTFKTAVRDDEAFSFAVIGDTEARPHINDVVVKRIWDERPDFVINCGDLTDGGRLHNRFEWTHEYFLGVGQLHSRIPCFPVAGNGEGDLVWYKHYHALPESEGFYSFRFGNAEFFMLDSNRSRTDFKPGGEQYEWISEKLAASDATWKFVAHHHAVYSSDEDDYGNTWKGEKSHLGDPNVQPMASLYEKHGVDAVFFGHLHTFERSWPVANGEVNLDEGVVYIQTGGGGGNLEDFTPTRSWFNQKSFRGHHYCNIDIKDNILEFRMYNTDGSMRDLMRVVKDENGRNIADAGE